MSGADMKDAIGATARLFWLYQGIALAAALLAFLPDKSRIYQRAIQELRRLETIQVTDVADTVKSRAMDEVGNSIVASVKTAAEARHLSLSQNLLDNIELFRIEQGPSEIDFRQSVVARLLDTIDGYARNPRFVVAAPAPQPLASLLSEKLEGQTGMITHVAMLCFERDRCQAVVDIDPDGDEQGAANELTIWVPRNDVTLNFGVRDLLMARDPTLKTSWFEVSALKSVLDEIAELTPSSAIARLREVRKGEEKPLSIFDVSLSGSTARMVAPLALALMAFAAWVSASGLARLHPAQAEIDAALFLPLINTPPANVLRIVAFAFPIVVSEGLLLRAPANGLLACAVALVSLAVQVWASHQTFMIFAKLRVQSQTASTLQRLGRLNLAFAGLSILGCLGWALAVALAK